MARHPFVTNIAERMAETGMTVDAMLDAACEFDPGGYSREALRSMYNGLRPMRLRMMSAMAQATGYEADQDPYFTVALVRYRLDEDIHEPDGAVANLAALKMTGKLEVTPEEIKTIPVARRKDSLHDGSEKLPGPRKPHP